VTTSGTTGVPGIFVIDDRTLQVTNALMLRMVQPWIGIADVIKVVAGGGGWRWSRISVITRPRPWRLRVS